MIRKIKEVINLMNTYNIKSVSQSYGMSNGFEIHIRRKVPTFSTFGNTGISILLSEGEFANKVSSAYINAFYQEIAKKILSRHTTNKTREVSNKIYSLSISIAKNGFNENLLKEGLKELDNNFLKEI